jgi:hypothetical protein
LRGYEGRIEMRETGHAAGTIAALWTVVFVHCAAGVESGESAAQKETVVTARATGSFDVKLDPLPLETAAGDSALGRMSIDKTYHGDLEGTGQGQMLSAMTDVKGSAGYVAIERVRGSLRGRSGTFVLQHTGTMNRGAQALSITVVPDSGTGELRGLTGKMAILIADGKHLYDFEYTTPDSP